VTGGDGSSVVTQVMLIVMQAAPIAVEAEPVPVGLSFTEGIPEHERVSLRETFDQVLPRACEPPPCTHDCPDDVPTIALLIGGDSRDYTLRWELSAPQLDSPLIIDSSCELCSLVEFEDQFATDLGSLCQRLAALETAPGRLSVSSEPSGARLRVDGKTLDRRQRTPWVGELAAGEHRIEVYARGYESQAHTLEIVGRVSERAHFDLLPSATGRPRWPGWTSLGLGIAMGVAGSALIALDNKPWTARCSGGNIDDDGNCQFVYATLPLGIGLSVVGAIAAGTGCGLIVWADHGRAGRTSAGLTFHGRF
jgi:hypothetical protein